MISDRAASISRILPAPVQRALVTSPIASERLARAEGWLAGRPRGEEVLVVGASHEAATDLTRRVARQSGASFGWYRATLGRVAAVLAGPELAARGSRRRGASARGDLRAGGRCAEPRRGARAARGGVRVPNLPRALARTLSEVRLAGSTRAAAQRGDGGARADSRGVRGGARARQDRGSRAGAADRDRGGARGAHAAAHGGRLVGARADPQASPLARRRAGDDGARARPRGGARGPRARGAGDGARGRRAVAAPAARGARRDARAGLARARARGSGEGALAAAAPDVPLRGGRAPLGRLDGDVTFLSAPGESRECVEVARRAQQRPRAACPSIAWRSCSALPALPRAPRRGAAPRGDPRPFRARERAPRLGGPRLRRALDLRREKLSARRFAEYLSLGQVPEATSEGAPPSAVPESDRWVPPDDEIVRTAVVRGAAFDALDGPIAAEERFVAAGPPRLRRRERARAAALGEALDRVGGARRDRSLERAPRRPPQQADQGARGPRGQRSAQDRVRRSLVDLAALRRFALPLLRELELLRCGRRGASGQCGSRRWPRARCASPSG